MLKLNKPKPEAQWLDASKIVRGVKFLMAPITPAMILAARSAGSSTVLNGLKSAKITEGDTVTSLSLEGAGEAAFTRLIVQAGMRDWKGVGDAKGKVTPPTPDLIDELLTDWRFFQFFDRQYVNPALSPASEKNA